jgi:Initiator Replication protein
MTNKPKVPKSDKTTAEVAIAVHRDYGLEKIIKAAEVIQARPAREKALGLAASKALNLMLGVAGGSGFEDKMYSLPKKELRRSHKSNEHIPNILDELHTTLFRLETVSPRGKPAIMRAPLLTSTFDELDDQDDNSLVYFRFTSEFLAVHRDSRLWAAISGPIMIGFDSLYALRLYEIGCQMVGRHNPVLALTVPELRELLRVPSGKYRDWTDLRRKTLDAAVSEINQLADFNVLVPEDRIRRSGRKIISLELRFMAKRNNESEAAAHEREISKIGRRARRESRVDQIVFPDNPSADDLALLWKRVRGLVQDDPGLKRHNPKSWLAQLDLVTVADGLATLKAEKVFVAEWIGRHLDQALQAAFVKVTGGSVGKIRLTS